MLKMNKKVIKHKVSIEKRIEVIISSWSGNGVEDLEYNDGIARNTKRTESVKKDTNQQHKIN